MPSKKKSKNPDDGPVLSMPETYDLTIPSGERASDEINIAVSEVSVRSEDMRVGPSGYHVQESGIGKSRIVLASPASGDVTFQVCHSNLEPNSETGAKTEEVHKTPMTL